MRSQRQSETFGRPAKANNLVPFKTDTSKTCELSEGFRRNCEQFAGEILSQAETWFTSTIYQVVPVMS